MTDSIREQIFENFGAKLQTALIENGYNIDLGAEVLRGFLPPINFEYCPAVGFLSLVEENTNLYNYKSNYSLQIQVQGIAPFGTIPPAQKVELIYADLIECILGHTWTLKFDSGGPYKAVVGATITGQSSGASGYISGVSLSSGDWTDEDAAGTFSLRRVKDDFINNEKLDIGSEDDVATVDGVLSNISALTSTLNDIADSIDIINAEPQFPNQGDKAVGMNIVFQINYKRIAGNPYSQTN